MLVMVQPSNGEIMLTQRDEELLKAKIRYKGRMNGVTEELQYSDKYWTADTNWQMKL